MYEHAAAGSNNPAQIGASDDPSSLEVTIRYRNVTAESGGGKVCHGSGGSSLCPDTRRSNRPCATTFLDSLGLPRLHVAAQI
jgi:hypothetical protein